MIHRSSQFQKVVSHRFLSSIPLRERSDRISCQVNFSDLELGMNNHASFLLSLSKPLRGFKPRGSGPDELEGSEIGY